MTSRILWALALLLACGSAGGASRQATRRQIEIELAGQKAARSFVERFIDGAHDELPARMAPGLRAELTPARLGLARRELVGAMGSPKVVRSPIMIDAGAHNASRGRSMFLVPVVYERGTLDLGILLGPAGDVVDFLWATRTQVVGRPPPYRESEVALSSGRITLTGTLALPDGDGPHPAVILISGSGKQDRDHTAWGHQTFGVLADRLTRTGVATLRLDDRGAGGSTGNEIEATLPELAGDVVAAVGLLGERQEIDPERVGLIGYSYGGLVAALAASVSDDVSFVVLLAVPTRPGHEFGPHQAAQVWRACRGDADAEGLERHLEGYREAMERVLAEAGRSRLSKATRKYLRSWAPEDYELLQSAWMRHVAAFDPRPALAALDVPVLALFGQRDRQVDASVAAVDLRRALEARNDATVEVLGEINHLLQKSDTGCPGEYRWIEHSVDPGLMNVVSEWILARSPSGVPPS